jgi:hypothetical protein
MSIANLRMAGLTDRGCRRVPIHIRLRCDLQHNLSGFGGAISGTTSCRAIQSPAVTRHQSPRGRCSPRSAAPSPFRILIYHEYEATNSNVVRRYSRYDSHLALRPEGWRINLVIENAHNISDWWIACRQPLCGFRTGERSRAIAHGAHGPIQAPGAFRRIAASNR